MRAPRDWRVLGILVLVGLALGIGVKTLGPSAERARIPFSPSAEAEIKDCVRQALDSADEALVKLQADRSDGVEVPRSSAPTSPPTLSTANDAQVSEQDTEWKKLHRTEDDSMEYLASRDGLVFASRLFRARDMNPTDAYIAPDARRLLEQIVEKYKAAFAPLDKKVRDATLREADILRKEGLLPNTGKIELSDSEKRQVAAAGGLAVRRLRSRRPDASDDDVARARSRGEAEMVMNLRGGNIMLDNGDGTFAIASDKQFDTVRLVNSNPTVAFLRLDRAMTIVHWFQQQGTLSDGSAAALIEHYYSVVAKQDQNR